MNYNKVKLPRGYLSWSQYDTINNQGEDAYIRKYIDGGESVTTLEMEFGKTFAEVLEGADTEDDIVEMVKAMVPKYKKAEYEMRAFLRAGGREVELFGKLDTYDELPTCDFWDYKTGKGKWTQAKAEKYEQLLFYKVMIWLNHNINPKSGIVWAETEDYYGPEDDREIVFTGKVQIFPVEHSKADILKMMGKILKTALRIEEIYKQRLEEIFN